MRRAPRLATHFLSTACGVLMVAAVGIGASGTARIAAAAALVAVTVAVWLRPVSTFAVLLTVLAVALSGAPATVAAVSGLSAAAYLVLRHAAGSGSGLDVVSGATMVSAVGFTLVGLVSTAFPLRLPWLPLLAPLAVFAVYLLATRPYLRDDDG
jgi:hypothetical protein